MNRVTVFLKSAYSQQRLKKFTWSKNWTVSIVILGILCAGLGVAYLVSSGDWIFASLLVFAIPVLAGLMRFPFIALLIWLSLSPFLVQTPTTAERMVYWLIHRLLPVLTLGIMLVSSVMRISTRRLPRFSLAEFAMLGYVAATVISIIVQNNAVPATLILFYDRTFIPMSLYWLIKLSAPGEKHIKWLLPVALYFIITQVAIGTLSWIMPSALPSYWLKYAGERTTGSLNSVSVYTTTLTFAGMFVLYAALKMKQGFKRNFLILVYLSTIYATFISFSRASWLAGGLVMLGIIALYPRFMFRLISRVLPIVVLLGGTLMVTQLQYAQERLYSGESSQTALSRLPVLVAAYRMFEAKPILGWGYGNFDRYDRQFQGRFGDFVNPDEKDLTSHNVYLTLLAEQGIVGFTLALLPVFWLLYKTIMTYSHLPRSGFKSRNMIIMLWLVVLSYFVVNNFAPMVVVFGLGIYWVTLGLIANILQAYSPTQ